MVTFCNGAPMGCLSPTSSTFRSVSIRVMGMQVLQKKCSLPAFCRQLAACCLQPRVYILE